MIDLPVMSNTSSVVVIDTLNSLLEAELTSIFRFMGEGSPYLSRASAEVRKPLNDMVQASHRRADELAKLIDALGGNPVPGSLTPEEQYLAYLSLKFLLPKLVEAEEVMVRRYEAGLRAIGKMEAEAAGLMQRHLGEHRQQLEVVNKAAAMVAAGK